MPVSFDSIWLKSKKLPRFEKIKLMEKLARQLRIEAQEEEESLNWDQLYGIGKDVWDMDAQEYVNGLREDRF